MTTNRINHRAHNHPNTPAARAACRKGMAIARKAINDAVAAQETTPMYRSASSRLTHRPVMDRAGNVTRIACSSRLPRGEMIESTSRVYTCNRCEGVDHKGGRGRH